MPKKSRQIDPIHDKLLLLDRLEELREDMEELEITSREELLRRIAELEAELDDGDSTGAINGPV